MFVVLVHSVHNLSPPLHSCAREGMMATLRSYQLRAVGWMLAREGAMSWPGSAPCWRGQHPLWTTVWPENSSKLCGEPFYFNFHTGRCCTCPVHVDECKLCTSLCCGSTSWPVGLWCDLNGFVCADVCIMANSVARHDCIQSLLSQMEEHTSSVCGRLYCNVYQTCFVPYSVC